MPLDTQQLIEGAQAHASAVTEGAAPQEDLAAFGEWLGLGPPLAEQKDVVAKVIGGRVDEKTGESYVTSDWIRQQLQNSNVDVSNADIVAALTLFTEWSVEDANVMMQVWMSDPKYQVESLATPYSSALEASGFTGGEFALPATPGIRLLSEQGISPAAVGPKGPVSQAETGWQAFSNGVLVNKADSNPWSAVVFKPNSLAPGSSWWYDSISQGTGKWTQEQVASWRERLVELGYLDKQYEKTEGLDEIFRQAITEYHVYRYYNGGKATPLDAAAGGAPHPSLTPKDFLESTRNNVRQQFMAVFGSEPSDAELQSWTRFTIKTASELQRKYMRRGLEESSALAAARTEAGEMAANRLWEDPLATEMRGNYEENTKLSDALQRAVSVTEGLIG